MVAERLYRGDHYCSIDVETSRPRDDVHELLGTEFGRKPSFDHTIICQLQSEQNREHAGRPVSYVAERPTVDEGRGSFSCLHEVRLQRILEKRRHRADSLEVSRTNRLS